MSPKDNENGNGNGDENGNGNGNGDEAKTEAVKETPQRDPYARQEPGSGVKHDKHA